MKKLNFIHTVDLECCKLEFSDENIVRLTFLADKHVTLESVAKLQDVVKEHYPSKFCLLTVTELGATFDPSVRNISAERKTNSVADAVIAKSLVEKILGNFYIRVSRPKVPTRLFVKHNLAIEWLRNQLR